MFLSANSECEEKSARGKTAVPLSESTFNVILYLFVAVNREPFEKVPPEPPMYSAYPFCYTPSTGFVPKSSIEVNSLSTVFEIFLHIRSSLHLLE